MDDNKNNLKNTKKITEREKMRKKHIIIRSADYRRILESSPDKKTLAAKLVAHGVPVDIAYDYASHMFRQGKKMMCPDSRGFDWGVDDFLSKNPYEIVRRFDYMMDWSFRKRFKYPEEFEKYISEHECADIFAALCAATDRYFESMANSRNALIEAKHSRGIDR